MQRRMQEALKNLYEQEVAAPVREYLESKSAPAVRPKRTARGSKPQAGTPAGELMRKDSE